MLKADLQRKLESAKRRMRRLAQRAAQEKAAFEKQLAKAMAASKRQRKLAVEMRQWAIEREKQLLADYVGPIRILLKALEEGNEPVAAYFASRLQTVPRLSTNVQETFITSIRPKRRLKGWKAGRVFAASMTLAGKMIFEGTHRLSTTAEVKAWRAEHERQKTRGAGEQNAGE